MFTGLVQTTGVVEAITDGADNKRLRVAATLREGDRILGASVCVSGVCLTVTDSGPGFFSADAAFETLAVTTLGELVEGSTVNLEPSLRLGDALGGHLVSGHVDGVGHLREVTARGEARECWFWAPEGLRRYLAVKGSVTVDGVSLTVNAVDETGFMVGLIPHTLEVTTLGRLIARLEQVEAGAEDPRCNLEVDMLARYVERLLGARVHNPGLPGLPGQGEQS